MILRGTSVYSKLTSHLVCRHQVKIYRKDGSTRLKGPYTAGQSNTSDHWKKRSFGSASSLFLRTKFVDIYGIMLLIETLHGIMQNKILIRSE